MKQNRAPPLQVRVPRVLLTAGLEITGKCSAPWGCWLQKPTMQLFLTSPACARAGVKMISSAIKLEMTRYIQIQQAEALLWLSWDQHQNRTHIPDPGRDSQSEWAWPWCAQPCASPAVSPWLSTSLGEASPAGEQSRLGMPQEGAKLPAGHGGERSDPPGNLGLESALCPS